MADSSWDPPWPVFVSLFYFVVFGLPLVPFIVTFGLAKVLKWKDPKGRHISWFGRAGDSATVAWWGKLWLPTVLIGLVMLLVWVGIMSWGW